MTSKGVYPYEYIDNYNKLYETQLPEEKNNIHLLIILVAVMKIINVLLLYGISFIAIPF